MSRRFEEGRELIVNALLEKIHEKMEGQQAKLCAEFTQQFFSAASMNDLQEWDVDDLYGAAIRFWGFVQRREPHEIKVRIYNPEFGHHGWQTTHTVVEVICEDMSFLVDSLRMVINRMGLTVHLIFHMGGIRFVRDELSHEVTQVLPRYDESIPGATVEAPIFIEIDRQTDPAVLEELHRHFQSVLADNIAVVEDWQPMRDRMISIIQGLEKVPTHLDADELDETKAFLTWIEDHHFTFLGMRDYDLVHKGKDTLLQPVAETGLGVLRDSLSQSNEFSISSLVPEARELTTSNRILIITKTNTLASVHRDAYTDYIGVKRFDDKGKVIGERRILGLYTSAAYNTNPKHIPFLRHKVALILKNSMLNPRSHAGRVLLNILETLPRDDLIQGSDEELLDISLGIFQMQERRRIRMFIRKDIYQRFISCLVYVPKDRFNTELRREMQEILAENFNAREITFSMLFSESILARIHFIIRIDPEATADYDYKAIEQKLIEVGRSWSDDLQYLLSEAYGEEKSNQLFSRYKQAFPAVYTTNFSPRTAVLDINQVEALTDENSLGMNFYRPLVEYSDNFRLKIYQHNITIPLSDVIPIIENLGLRAISERPYVLKFDDGKITWINDFSLHYTKGSKFELDEIKELFQNAFLRVWFGFAENDGFNQLVLAAGLDWRQVSILRTYAKYFKQIGSIFSQVYVEAALNNNPTISKKLVHLFEIRFQSEKNEHRTSHFEALTQEILNDLDEVSNLDEDKIIREYLQAISSTLRTNYYQINASGKYSNYIAIKLNCKGIRGVPKPHPMYEIFVYSPKFEAVHLRSSKVARGGLRWSDRREDFRTEILGLMKAQQVKNAVIVPSGAKGGFVPKQLPLNATREEILAEGVSCYKEFIRSLLDITDNYKDGVLVKPRDVICYDEDDPYLVVAADKGTATFSDIANDISLEYNFWLGDAFASGGSFGYDHKKMGITAKGAWESVKRHFHHFGLDINTTDFSVVGIGDMAGDVFGNGMLLSNHIKLVAAFNHQHIFIDPTPDHMVSFQERERLFHLPRSTWADYDKKLISKGGGVFNRNAKSIVVSKEMKHLFGIRQANIEPNELIKMLLRAKVDLLWSGGIGTFVKANFETNLDVGDRSNDSIRINGKQLRCKVVVEGGNLGLTQLGRVEYALNGGLIYTDFIDNSAGVSCSDKEVNIKILLNGIVASGELTFEQRNELLSDMTNEVSRLVLRENYLQTKAISLSATQAKRTIELHSRYIIEMERLKKIDRALEFLPEQKALMERKLLGKGLTTPEISVLLCYSKNLLKEAILASDVPEDPYLKRFLISSFPHPLQVRYVKEMQLHPLKREIIATRVSNCIVNEVGFGFVYRLQDETGASISSIVRAYIITRSLLNMDDTWSQIEALDKHMDALKQSEVMTTYVRLLRRLTRWFLRTQRMKLDISKAIKKYSTDLMELRKVLPSILGERFRTQFQLHVNEYTGLGIPPGLSLDLTETRGLFAAMDIIEIAQQQSRTIDDTAQAYFGIGEYLELDWIRSQIISHPSDNHWEALTREALRDDLDWQQCQLTACILATVNKKQSFEKSLEIWAPKFSALIDRWHLILTNLRSSLGLNYTMFFVAIRELLDLTQTTIQMSENRKTFEDA